LCPKDLRVLEDTVVELVAGVDGVEQQPGTSGARQLDVGRPNRRRLTGEQEVTVHADDPCSHGRGRAEVRRRTTGRNEDVGLLGDCCSDQELQGPRFVASDSEAGEIVTLEEEGPDIEGTLQSRRANQRGRKESELDPRKA
jgi:hypothetical protein